jgi:tRNA(Ile)-lysidine synthase
MQNFDRSLITEWRRLKLPVADETIVVAVSGGPDSMSLLLAIYHLVTRQKLELKIIVAHFNHRLRGDESDADERFTAESAKQLGFEFVSRSANVRSRGNLEQNARDARYEFLASVAHRAGAFAVLTAHTQNDQAETFLMNLIRGSGPDGLAGISGVRQLDGPVLLVRPLLSWARREDTERFCREHDIACRTDRMNDDEAFTRVRLRKTVIPLLAELNPKIVETLARTSDLLRQIIAETEDRSDVTGDDTLRLAALKTLSKAELYSQLRGWLRMRRGNLRSLQLKHIEAIERLILSRKSGKTVELPGGGTVVKQGGSLVFSNIKVEK